MSTRRAVHAPWLALALGAIGIVAAIVLPEPLALRLAAEHGPLERVQALLLVAAIPFVWLPRGGRRTRLAGASTLVLIAMAARELEWHTAFTGGNMLKLRFYLEPHPLGVKIAGATVLVLLAVCGVLLALEARTLRAGLARRAPWAVSAVTFASLVVASRLADKSLGLARQLFGYDASTAATAAKMVIEESLELGLPLTAVMAALQLRAETTGDRRDATRDAGVNRADRGH